MQLMQRRINQMFDQSFDRGLGKTAFGALADQPDFKLDGDRYVMKLNIPDMDKESIDVEIKNGFLVISAKRSSHKENKGDHFYSQQRSFGQFMKSLTLPPDAKSDRVQARYDKGVLEVIIERDKNVNTGGSDSRKIIVQ
jgi:HSP20 family protein